MACYGLACLGALPKAGSFYTGEEPPAPAGGWPPFKGKVGPRQTKCLELGGRWIGPTGRKWCQLTTISPGVVEAPIVVPAPISPVVPVMPVPAPGAPPLTVVGAPVDSSLIPVGEEPGGPAFGPPPGAEVEDFVIGDSAGPQVMSVTTTTPTAGTGYMPYVLGAAAIVGAILFLRKRPGAGRGVRRRTVARRRR